jgi:hypothetical protein
LAAAIFAIVSAVYALTAWDRVLGPSDHFHFVDLAHSFLDGRLDTDTPRRARNRPANPDDPPGLQAAIDRALTDSKGQAVGWNDWSSYRVITLTSGEQLSGVWPWKNEKDHERRHEFHTLDGQVAEIDPAKDVARTCGDNGKRKCDETRYYISFPPFPAVVMLPFAALWGYDTNDVVITIVFAGFTAALMWLFFLQLRRRGYLRRSDTELLWLTALFAFGTVAFFSSVRGEVWFTALVIGLTLNTGYAMAALDAKHPILAGTLLALGYATRTPLMFAAAFMAFQLLWPASGERFTIKQILAKGALFSLPILAVGAALMAMNEARFDNPFEFGHIYLAEGTRDSIRKHGLFSSWFLNRNLQAMLVNLPVLTFAYPWVHISRHGLSLFATTPPLALLTRYRCANVRLSWALWGTVLAVAIPAAFYQNTGWSQFGFRFSLDWTPYMMALLAVDERAVGRGYKVLILLAILVNLFGAVTFERAAMLYYD